MTTNEIPTAGDTGAVSSGCAGNADQCERKDADRRAATEKP